MVRAELSILTEEVAPGVISFLCLRLIDESFEEIPAVYFKQIEKNEMNIARTRWGAILDPGR